MKKRQHTFLHMTALMTLAASLVMPHAALAKDIRPSSLSNHLSDWAKAKEHSGTRPTWDRDRYEHWLRDHGHHPSHPTSPS